MTFEVKLLGKVNSQLFGSQSTTLSPKYVAVVTANELQMLLRYQKADKSEKRKTPYKIDAGSIIQIDEDAQRGYTEDRYLLQDKIKVSEIRDALLGVSKEVSTLFAGTLIWNIRPDEGSKIEELVQADANDRFAVPTRKLKIITNAVWLTDSAHRHLGIVEAYSAWASDKEKYKDFDPNLEFSVDIYNLDKTQEMALFRELNAKQKKISASKQQHTDTSSAIGMMKSAILAYDAVNAKLFDQNIEVSLNENARHTLMTMSVFTSSVQLMFGKELLDQAKEEDVLRDELAEFYCNWFKKLSDTIEVKYTHRGQVHDAFPFQNLYATIIAPEIDRATQYDNEQEAESQIALARERAKEINTMLQLEEKIHSNAVVKALSRLARSVRRMKNWEVVIDNIQTRLIASNGGRYFQKTNDSLFGSSYGRPPIATKKADGTINIQVVDGVIREIETHLKDALDLVFKPRFFATINGGQVESVDSKFPRNLILEKNGENYIDLKVTFQVASEFPVTSDTLALRLEALPPCDPTWKRGFDKTGKTRLRPVSVTRTPGYVHGVYGDGVVEYEANFEVTAKPYTDSEQKQFEFIMDFEYPDFDGEPQKQKISCIAQT